MAEENKPTFRDVAEVVAACVFALIIIVGACWLCNH